MKTPMDEEQQSNNDPQEQLKQARFERDEEFESLYANNVIIESSSLDATLVFGQLDTHTGSPVIQQHTAVSLPWPTAKLLVYFLQVLIADQESQNGKVKIPIGILPPIIPVPEGANPRQQKVIELAQQLHHQLVADLAKPEE